MVIVMTMLIAIVMAGCGTVAHIEKDETVNFSSLRTYSWDSEKSIKDRNSNDLIDSKLKAAVSKELEKSGWREARSNPDVILDYNIVVENTTKEKNNPVYSRSFVRYYYNPFTRRLNSVYYPSRMLGYETQEIPVREGTITLHMIDRKTNKLIWQGWTTDEVNSRNLTSKEVSASVKSIMRRFSAG
jgi:hypothetical protein